MSKKLTEKQKCFVEEYLVDLNATQAAIRAGYSPDTARATGHENLTKPNISEAIQTAIEERSKRTQIDQDMVIKELYNIAFIDIRQAYDEEGKLLTIHKIPEDIAPLLGTGASRRLSGIIQGREVVSGGSKGMGLE